MSFAKIGLLFRQLVETSKRGKTERRMGVKQWRKWKRGRRIRGSGESGEPQKKGRNLLGYD